MAVNEVPEGENVDWEKCLSLALRNWAERESVKIRYWEGPCREELRHNILEYKRTKIFKKEKLEYMKKSYTSIGCIN